MLTDTPEVDAILPPRLRSGFAVPSALLSVVIFASVIGSLVFTLLISIVRARAERRRMLLEARDRSAKRLRHRRTHAEVNPPPLEEGSFHVFLSHTWAQGEEAMRTIKLMLIDMMPEARVFLGARHGCLTAARILSM